MKLSVITINLNNKRGLEKTVKSVLSQTYTDFEYLVIDGGSTDGSIDVIKDNAQKINYWISEPDKGIYNAMNKAIVKAKGEYCYFLNSGDYLVSDKVFEHIFQGNPQESFICGNFICDKNGKQEINNIYKSRDWSFSLYDIYSGFLAHQAFFIKKKMFDKYGLYDERLRIMSDWKLFFEAIGIHNESVLYKDVDISVYDMDGLSSHIGGQVIYEEKVRIAKEVLPLDLFEKLDRLYFLEKNGFIVDFIRSKKWINFVFKVFYKICTLLKLTKV